MRLGNISRESLRPETLRPPRAILREVDEVPEDIEDIVFDIRTEYFPDYNLTPEEVRLIAGKVAELRSNFKPAISKETEKNMDAKWQLYLGLFIAAAAMCGIAVAIAGKRKNGRGRPIGETRGRPHRETSPNTTLGESPVNSPMREVAPPPNAFGVSFPSSPEWEQTLEFLKSRCPGSLRGSTLYLDQQTIDKLRGYGHWKPQFVEALCKASGGRLEPISPSVGDVFDVATMERDEQLSGECKVTSVISLGLRETGTGKIVGKAFVSVC